MATLVLTLIGDDRAGLVNAVADVVARHGGNWERSQMAELGGKFAGIVLVTAPDAAADGLVASLEPLHGLLDVTAQIAPGGGDASTGERLVSLDLVGGDRPGIVSEISRVLTDLGVSIDTLTTEVRDAPMAGGRLFEAHAVLAVPAAVDDEHLQDRLEALANEMMVDLALQMGSGTN
jgi:glycine cleavage system regulatory protein